MPTPDTPPRSPSDATESGYTNEDYTVGWICALHIELAASKEMLDKRHPDLPQDEKDSNTYTLGQIGPHNVVLACLPSGTIGAHAAATAANDLLRSFPKIRFGLMVGVGGGAPATPSDDPSEDLRLGDVVVSTPEGAHGGVLQYDFGRTIKEGKFTQTGVLNKPPIVLRAAVSQLRAQHETEESAIRQHVLQMLKSKPKMMHKYKYQGAEHDQLFESDYDHDDSGKGCDTCDKERLLSRKPRDTEDPVIHYGLIGSANQVMRHGATREMLRQEKGILCFEMEAAGLMDNFPCLVIRGICDYSDTHKNKRWQPYAAATAAAYAKELLEVIPPSQVASTKEASKIVELVRAEVAPITEKLGPLIDGQQRKERDEILDWIIASRTYEQQHMDILKQRQPGTGQWFLESPEFTRWLRGDSRTLFCSGIPGAGKSVLTSIAIEHIRAQAGRGSHVAFIYCNYKRQEEQTTERLLGVVLRQFLGQCASVPESVKTLYDNHRSKGTHLSHEEILHTLSTIVGNQDRAYLVIDALDECPDNSREHLLTNIRELQNNTHAKVMATSRPVDDIERWFAGDTRLRIQADSADVERYLDDHRPTLSECVREDDDLWNEIKAEIVKAADGMFLLAHLHFESLKGERRARDIRKALRALPQGLQALPRVYDSAMDRIDLQGVKDGKWARRVLSWVVCAKRPLTPTELQHALCVEIGDRELQATDLSLGEVISLCAGLVTLNKKSNVVQLVHYTAQQYFEDTQQQLRLSWIRTAQKLVAATCITYLSFDVFEAGSCATVEDFKARLQKNPLFDYAAGNWGHHASTVSIEEQLILGLLGSEAKVSSCSQALMVSRGYSLQLQRTEMTAAHLAAYFGLSGIITILFKNNYPLDCEEDIYRWTPLSWAAQMRHEAVVQLLLDYGADVAAKDSNGWTPLLHATIMGCKAMVKLLIEQGADIEARDNYKLTPLLWAAERRHEAVVQLLLDYGADVTAKDSNGWTPLFYAIRGGCKAVVKLLIEQGADIEARDNRRLTPLSWAAEMRHEAVVQLLLDYGANIEVRDNRKLTPLLWAASRGHEAVVKLLLDYGANGKAKDSNGWTPLLHATRGGYKAVVKLLIEQGADIEARDNCRLTPLSWAASRGHKAVVKLLLDYGANGEAKDRDGQTPLSRAANKGHKAVVKLLRQHSRRG